MAFVFRLERVARYRQSLVDEQARRLAAAERVVGHVQASIAAIEEDLGQLQAEFCAPADGPVSVQSMMARTGWASHLEELRDGLKAELASAREEAEQQRESLRAAWRDLEVLNTLREKQRGIWQSEQDRRERLALDEVGQIRADRQRRTKVAS